MWPWELYEMLNLSAAIERAAEFDIIHYEAAYYPMSLAFARLSPTPIIQTLHHAPSAAEVALWSRYPEAPFVAISNEQARLLAGVNVVGTVLHGIDTDRSRSARLPTTTCSSSAGSPKARACCRRSRSPSAWACGWSSRPPRTSTIARQVAPHVDGTRIVYHRRGGLRDQGEAVRRRARAALSDPGARAVRPRARRSHGLRHAGRRPRPRRGARDRRRRCHRVRVRRSRSRW